MLGELPTLATPAPRTQSGVCLPLDATLGVPGHPQSGTGQVALFTGLNGAKIFGRHFGPWTPVKLRRFLAAQNLFVQAVDAGFEVAFANAYPEGYPDGVSSRRLAAPPLAAHSVGALVRSRAELREGLAVSSGIDNEGWRRHLGVVDLPTISDEEAGRNLARVVGSSDLTVYAHYNTDHVGHEGTLEECAGALEKVDRFFSGLVEGLDDETVVVVASDHGNIEAHTASHTRNPVMGVVYRRAGLPNLLHEPLPASRLSSIMDIPPLILGLLAQSERKPN